MKVNLLQNGDRSDVAIINSLSLMILPLIPLEMFMFQIVEMFISGHQRPASIMIINSKNKISTSVIRMNKDVSNQNFKSKRDFDVVI